MVYYPVKHALFNLKKENFIRTLGHNLRGPHVGIPYVKGICKLPVCITTVTTRRLG